MSDSTTLGTERFISLTTFRRDGSGVATPVWLAGDERSGVVAFTPDGTGKVKRLRRDPRVEVRPCDRRGRVEAGAPTYAGTAELVHDTVAVDAIRDRLRRKYGWEFRIFMVVERLVRRGREPQRVGLRLQLDPAA